MSKEQVELDKARGLVAEDVEQKNRPVPNTVSDGTGPLDPRFALWRSFCAKNEISVETLPGDLEGPLQDQWEKFKEVEIHRPEEGRTK